MTNLEIAKIIMEQLGGNKFVVMCGVKDVRAVSNGVGFKIMKNNLKCNYIEIKLNGNDLYDIKYYSIRGTNVNVKHELNDVYAEDMISLMEEDLGLYFHL